MDMIKYIVKRLLLSVLICSVSLSSSTRLPA